MKMFMRQIKKGKLLKFLIVAYIILATLYYCIYELSENKEDDLNMKYILLWVPTSISQEFQYFKEGQQSFKMRKCRKVNCYLTDNKMLLNNVTNYDAIVFNGPDIFGNYNVYPPIRSPHQKYIFASRTSSEICEAPSDKDGYFNWTWTYKINSDIPMGYITIRNRRGDIIGPKEQMHWLTIDEMIPVKDEVLDILDRKTAAVAWISSNCNTSSGRERYVKKLGGELSKYDLDLDIYGKCGSLLCPKFLMDHCLYTLQIDYYFYLAFENSFSDDYVTDSILHGLQNFAVPIVYGGANYTR